MPPPLSLPLSLRPLSIYISLAHRLALLPSVSLIFSFLDCILAKHPLLNRGKEVLAYTHTHTQTNTDVCVFQQPSRSFTPRLFVSFLLFICFHLFLLLSQRFNRKLLLWCPLTFTLNCAKVSFHFVFDLCIFSS